MKKFFIKILLFPGLVSIICIMSYFLNNELIRHDVFLLPDDVHTIIIGDSRAQTSLNPKLLPHSANISMSGEPFLATYLKLKWVVKNNPQVKQVVLGFSYHNFSEYQDRKFTEDGDSRRLFSRYNVIMKKSDLKNLDYNKTTWYMLFLNQRVLPNPAYVRNKFKALTGKKSRTYPYIGEYYPLYHSYIGLKGRKAATLKRHYYNDDKVAGLSQKALHSLDSMVTFTRNRNIELYLFVAPQHPLYLKDIPPLYTNNLEKLKSKYGAMDHVQIVDFSHLSLPDDQFADYDHLNHAGAQVVSKKMAEILEQ